jgi:hypothetical protein
MSEQTKKWFPADVLVTFMNVERGEAEIVSTSGEQLINGRIEDHPALAAKYLKRTEFLLPGGEAGQATPVPKLRPIAPEHIQPGIGQRTTLQSRVVHIAEEVLRREAETRQATPAASPFGRAAER